MLGAAGSCVRGRGCRGCCKQLFEDVDRSGSLGITALGELRREKLQQSQRRSQLTSDSKTTSDWGEGMNDSATIYPAVMIQVRGHVGQREECLPNTCTWPGQSVVQ